jgi:hypothetical protein
MESCGTRGLLAKRFVVHDSKWLEANARLFGITDLCEKKKHCEEKNAGAGLLLLYVWVMQEKINEVLPNTVETTFAAFVDVKSVPFGDA